MKSVYIFLVVSLFAVYWLDAFIIPEQNGNPIAATDQKKIKDFAGNMKLKQMSDSIKEKFWTSDISSELNTVCYKCPFYGPGDCCVEDDRYQFCCYNTIVFCNCG